MERLNEDEFIFNDDLRRYKNIHQLMAAYNDPQGSIYLHECLPPSEYGNYKYTVKDTYLFFLFFLDKSPLLLCRDDKLMGDSLTDSSAAFGILPSSPLCINSSDIQVYKGQSYSLYSQLFSICTPIELKGCLFTKRMLSF